MPPIFPILAAVVAGILSASAFRLSPLTWWSLLGLSALPGFRRPFRCWPIFACFLCLAGLRYSIVERAINQDPLKWLNRQGILLRFKPIGESVPRMGRKRFLAQVSRVHFHGNWLPVHTSVLVYSLRSFSEEEVVTAEGDLEDLSPGLSFYRKEGCTHAFQVARVLALEKQGNRFANIVMGFRERFESRLSASLAPPYDSVALGVILGRLSGVPHDILDDFRVTGTYHVLVASGLKVALVAGGTLLLTRFFSFYFRLAACALSVLLYTWVVGFQAPVLRAGGMALFGLVAFVFGRGRDSLGVYFLVCLILLFLNPFWLFEAGFQLSFLSVLGILLFFGRISRRLTFLRKWMADSIAVTVSAQLLIFIPLAFYFHNVSFVSPLANLLVVPLTAVSMFLGCLGFGLSFLWQPLGFAVWFWLRIALVLMVCIVQGSSRIPWAYLWVSPPGLLTVVLIYALIFAFLIPNRKVANSVIFGSASILAVLWIYRMITPPPPRITFLDVGQGDSCILSFGRKHFLVDGGGSPTEILPGGYSVGESVVVPALRAQGINRLDGILLTHPHRDHVGGLVSVLRKFPVKEIWLPPLHASSPVYKAFLKEAKRKKIPLLFVLGNEKLQLAKQDWIYFYWPIPPLLHGTVSDLNNNSVVSQWVIDGVRILLSGDVEIEGEGRLLHDLHPRSLLQSQILKVPHHGSGTSSTADFLRTVSPEVAIVSVGARNLYHHPSPFTMRRLHRKIGCVFRTDQDGTVEFILHSRGERTWIERVAKSACQQPY